MMENLFNPKSVAIIGASDSKGKIGNILLENLNKGGYKGKIYPVNPKHKKIGRLDCYGTVLDVDDEIDVAVIAIPAKFVPKIVQECAWHVHPIRNIIIISAGFSESGKEGTLLEAKLKNLAKEYELNIIGPNCLGAINTFENLNVSFAKADIKKGNIGLVMQSGAFTTALIDLAEKSNFGFSSIVTLGNKAVVDEVDFTEYFLKDENTKAVVFYLETIKRGREFIEKISALAKEKPVFILKAGNSKRVQAAIQSHTGSMAGEFEVAKKAIEKSGAIYFDSIADLVYSLKFFSGFKPPLNKKTVVVTNAGGPGVIATDLIEKKENIEILELEESWQKKIMEALVPACSAKNPVDVLGDADSERYEKVLAVLSKNKEVGSVLALITPQSQTDIEGIAKVILVANEKYSFPTIPIFIGGPAGDIADKILVEKNLCSFKFPVEAVSVLEKAGEFISKKSISKTVFKKNIARRKKAETIINNAEKEKNPGLYYDQATELANLYGIRSEKAVYLENEKDFAQAVKSGFPLVMKIDDPNILHKDANAGVVLGIKSKEELKTAFGKIRNKFKDSKILVQRQLSAGLEIILGIKRDPSFGMVALCGLGGIFAEIINEKSLWLVPATKEEIKKDLERSAIGKIFKRKGFDVGKLAEEVEKISCLAAENEGIKELDINPMFFYPDKKPVAVDIKGIIE